MNSVPLHIWIPGYVSGKSAIQAGIIPAKQIAAAKHRPVENTAPTLEEVSPGKPGKCGQAPFSGEVCNGH